MIIVMLAVASLLQHSMAAGSPLDAWTLRQRLAPPFPANAKPIRSVAYANGLFVGVGDGGQIASTSDPVRGPWKVSSSGTQRNLKSILFEMEQFVAVGDDGTIVKSTDGTNWTGIQGPTANDLTSISFGNGRFVAVGDRVSAASSDGVSWATVTLPKAELKGVAFGNGQFVAVGYDGDRLGVVLTSDAGEKWVARDAGLQASAYLADITFGNGVFVAVETTRRRILSSADGIDWQSQSSPARPGATSGSSVLGVAYGEGVFVAVSAKEILVSSDGSNWTISEGSLPSIDTDYSQLRFFSGVVHCGGLFIVSGQIDSSPSTVLRPLVVVSKEASVWKEVSQAMVLRGVAYGSGRFVSVGNNGTALVSMNGTAWQEAETGTGLSLNAIEFWKGDFVAAGDNGVILISKDGQTWSRQDSGIEPFKDINLQGAAHNDNMIAVAGARPAPARGEGEEAVVVTSADAKSWTVSFKGSGSDGDLRDLTYGNGRFLGIGIEKFNLQSEGRVWSSEDGSNWTWQDMNLTTLRALAFGRDVFAMSIFAAGRSSSEVQISSDGRAWVTRLTSAYVSGLTFERETFLALGKGDIWTSANGVAWTRRSIPVSSSELFDSAFGAGTFVAVGENGTIIQSALVDPMLADPRRTEAGFELTARVPAQQNAVVESADSLEEADWSVLVLVPGGAQGATQRVLDPTPFTAQRFYRLRSQ